MPYAPNVQDVSGQLRAQGITATGNNVAQGIQQWQQNEMLRRQAAGTAAGKIANNPFLQQQAQTNPDISALLTKVQSGQANLRDTQQLAGWASGAEDAQKQQLAAKQQQAQTQEIQQRILMQKKQDEDDQKAEAAMRDAAQSPAAEALASGKTLDAVPGLPTNRPASDIIARFMRSGAPMTPGAQRFLQTALSAEDARAATAERATAASDRTNELKQTAADRIATRNAIPVLTPVPGTDQFISTHNGQQMVVNKPVKATTVEEKVSLAKEIKKAMDAGDYDTAATLGMVLGHANPITGAPLGPDDYRQAFGGAGAAQPGAVPTLSPDQVRQAKPGKFMGTNGKSYEKLPNGTVRAI